MKLNNIFAKMRGGFCAFCNERLSYIDPIKSLVCIHHKNWQIALADSTRKQNLQVLNITSNKLWFYIYENADAGFFVDSKLSNITKIQNIDSFESLISKINTYENFGNI